MAHPRLLGSLPTTVRSWTTGPPRACSACATPNPTREPCAPKSFRRSVGRRLRRLRLVADRSDDLGRCRSAGRGLVAARPAAPHPAQVRLGTQPLDPARPHPRRPPTRPHRPRPARGPALARVPASTRDRRRRLGGVPRPVRLLGLPGVVPGASAGPLQRGRGHVPRQPRPAADPGPAAFAGCLLRHGHSPGPSSRRAGGPTALARPTSTRADPGHARLPAHARPPGGEPAAHSRERLQRRGTAAGGRGRASTPTRPMPAYTCPRACG